MKPEDYLGQCLLLPLEGEQRSLMQTVESLTKSEMEDSWQLGELRVYLGECEECQKRHDELLQHIITILLEQNNEPSMSISVSLIPVPSSSIPETA